MKHLLSIAEAKARFAEFVRRAERGQTIVLTRHGRPVAQLTPTTATREQGFSAGREVRETANRYEPTLLEQLPASAPLASKNRREALERLLEESVWTRVPEDQLGAGPDRREREAILGYGSDGV